MYILISGATPFELKAISLKWPAGKYGSTLTLDYLVTGVGPTSTSLLLTEKLCGSKPDLLLNIGLAGALDPSLSLGEVVHVVREEFGNLGIEEKNGQFTSVYSLGLVDKDAPPFKDGQLHVPKGQAFAKQVTGVTVSTVHGNEASIAAFKSRCDAQVESMEGAAATWVALRQNLPFVQLRAISNYVEPRNRDAWKIEEALVALTDALDQLLSALPGAQAARSAKQQLGL
ncbi:MAG: futalosine hydrolase [Saprospiraceae bacterium]